MRNFSISENPSVDEPLVIQMVYVEGPNYWERGNLVEVKNFHEADLQLTVWGNVGRADFLVYIHGELVYDGSYDLKMKPANLRRQMTVYLEQLGTEDADRLLAALVQQNPPELKKGYIDPDTGAWMSRRRFDEGLDEYEDAVVSETITEDEPTIDAINAALLAGTVGLGQSGLVTEASADRIDTGVPEPEPDRIRERMEIRRRMAGRAAALARRGEPEQLSQERLEPEQEQTEEYVLLRGKFEDQWFTPDEVGYVVGSAWLGPDGVEDAEGQDLVEAVIQAEYQPGVQMWGQDVGLWNVRTRDGESFDVYAVPVTHAVEEGWIQPPCEVCGGIDRGETCCPPTSDQFEAWLTEQYGQHRGLNADWISKAWPVTYDVWVVDAEDEDQGRPLYNLIRREVVGDEIEDLMLKTDIASEIRTILQDPRQLSGLTIAVRMLDELHGRDVSNWDEYTSGRHQAIGDLQNQGKGATLRNFERISQERRDPSFIRGYAEVLLDVPRFDPDASTEPIELPAVVLNEQFGHSRPLPWDPSAVGWFLGDHRWIQYRGDHRWIQYRRQQPDGTVIYAVIDWDGDSVATIFTGSVDEVITWLTSDMVQQQRRDR